jgi:hypothetical protein
MVTQLANVREALVISAMFSFDFMVFIWVQILAKKHIAQNIAKFVLKICKMLKTCESCSKQFECNVDDIANCQCSTVFIIN